MYRELVESTLKKAGARKLKRTPEGFSCCCLFHDESSPSFAVSDEGLYICYTAHCGQTGNIITLLMKVGGYSRKEVKDLIGKLPVRGNLERVKKPWVKKEEEQPYRERDVALYGALCPTYLLDRGFLKQTLRYFQVGFDQENDRVVIPLRDTGGSLVGFLRRSTVSAKNKYLLDTERAKDIIFNSHNCQEDYAIVVEGSLDCMWLHQLGFPETVALLRSKMTKGQTKALYRRFKRLVLMMDNDSAGYAGMMKMARELKQHCDIRIALLPEDRKDPQECSSLEIERCLLDAVPYASFVVGVHRRETRSHRARGRSTGSHQD